jgi:hypothetical protein
MFARYGNKAEAESAKQPWVGGDTGVPVRVWSV